MDINNVKEELKNLDMGVLLTKVNDAKARVDLSGVKRLANDIADSPKTDKLKGAARTVGEFGGFVKTVVGDSVKSLKK